ncbi:MAG: hypothetical protein HQL57_10480, partial [Magnetococcales bacterium]|nr:hypothetical protein [Magnetococcales bacterium]
MRDWNRALWLSALVAGMAGWTSVVAESKAEEPAAAAPAVAAPAAAASEHYAGAPLTPFPPAAGGLVAVRVEGKGPILDPAAPVWGKAKAVPVAMQAQTIATPQNNAPAVETVSARAVHNGQWLAVLLEWKDSTPSTRVVVDQFGDQVAVEYPIRFRPDAPPNPMMGAMGERVNIIQWRAAFQSDLELKRDREMRDLSPNAHADLYPDKVLTTFDMRSYMGAAGVDNPVAKHRPSPVLDQVAEGFGSLTVKQHQEADGA